MDAPRHAEVTGVRNEMILLNLVALVQAHAHVVIRFPVIPAINDNQDNINLMIAMMRQLGLREIDLLPYHRIGTDKYARLGRPYRLADLQPPSAEDMEKMRCIFTDAGMEVSIGG